MVASGYRFYGILLHDDSHLFVLRRCVEGRGNINRAPFFFIQPWRIRERFVKFKRFIHESIDP